MIALIPQHAKKIRPPRTLNVPYELGRPLGIPNDPAFQHRILDAALALFQHDGAAIFVDYVEEAPVIAAVDEQGWSCPVSFAQPTHNMSRAEKLEAEIALLKPWYERGKVIRSYTSVGLSGLDMSTIAEFLASLADPETPSINPLPDMQIGDALKYCAEDLKAFYNEAATSQPGNISANEAENWYWGETSAGQLVRAVRKATLNSEDAMLKLVANFILVPRSQAFRDS